MGTDAQVTVMKEAPASPRRCALLALLLPMCCGAAIADDPATPAQVGPSAIDPVRMRRMDAVDALHRLSCVPSSLSGRGADQLTCHVYTRVVDTGYPCRAAVQLERRCMRSQGAADHGQTDAACPGRVLGAQRYLEVNLAELEPDAIVEPTTSAPMVKVNCREAEPCVTVRIIPGSEPPRAHGLIGAAPARAELAADASSARHLAIPVIDAHCAAVLAVALELWVEECRAAPTPRQQLQVENQRDTSIRVP